MKLGKIIILLFLLTISWTKGAMAVEPLWQEMAGSEMPESLGSYYGVTYDEVHDRVFVVGGYTAISGSMGTTGVYMGQIQSNGGISWRRLQNFPVPIQGNFSYFDNARSKLVVVGGSGNSNFYKTVYVLTIDSVTGNSVGNWENDFALPVYRHFMAGLVYGGKVFIFGGRDQANNGGDTIYSRSLGSNGEWKLETRRLPYWGDSMAVVVNNGFIYVGGAQQENLWNLSNKVSCQTQKVYVAPISTTGEIGAWIATTSYPSSEHYDYVTNTFKQVLPIKAYHMMRAFGGYLYVGPGTAYNEFNNNSCVIKFDPTIQMNDTMRTYRAPIMPDGTLGSWQQYGVGNSDTTKVYDGYDWHKDKLASNVYGWVQKGSKIYQIGGMNYAGVSKAIYVLDLEGQGGVVPSPTPTVLEVITPVCVGSSGGGIINSGGSVTVTMTANTAMDNGELHVFNREYLVSGIPQRVKFGGVPVSITNGVKSADGKTISFQVNYNDLNKPDSNFNNSYLYQIQFNGVLKKGTLNTGYNANCVKMARLEPRPGTVVTSATPTLTSTPVPTIGVTTCGAGLPARSSGNANCDGGVNILDFEVWYGEYQNYKGGQTQAGGWRADFNGDGKSDMVDLGIWKAEWGK